jgi:hypothetical protein
MPMWSYVLGSLPALRLLALVGASLWLTLATVPASADPAHLGWAEEIALNVSPDNNIYATDPSYIHWPGVQGADTYENRTVCGTFVTRVLQQAYGWDGDDFKAWFKYTSSPFAKDYHKAIAEGNGFLIIQKISDIQSGDIIAIDYPDTPDIPDDPSGHVMIAAGPPARRSATAPVKAGTTQYTIEVIDSTQWPHGSTDTRCLGLPTCSAATKDTGAGIGFFRLYADAAGTIVGYTWSPEHMDDTDYYDQTIRYPVRHLTVGRLHRR